MIVTVFDFLVFTTCPFHEFMKMQVSIRQIVVAQANCLRLVVWNLSRFLSYFIIVGVVFSGAWVVSLVIGWVITRINRCFKLGIDTYSWAIRSEISIFVSVSISAELSCDLTNDSHYYKFEHFVTIIMN